MFKIILVFLCCVIFYLNAEEYCKDPEEIDLQEKLFKLQKDYSNFNQLEIMSRNRTYYDQDEPRKLTNKIDNSKCSEMNTTTCPRKYQVEYRNNKYPFYIREVKCTCESCRFHNNVANKTLYKCLPVWKEEPVLIRDKCESGLYFWREGYEWVNNGCVCAIIQNLNSHR